MKHPECPNKTPKECVFSHWSSSSTCLGWTPKFNRDGEMINDNPNITTTRMSCNICGKYWDAKTSYNDTTFELLNVRSEK